MASQPHQLHFILFPMMAEGHLIPMIDFAKLLAQRGVIVTMVTTTYDATATFEASVARAVQSGLPIQVIPLQFPYEEAGLSEVRDNVDKIPLLELGPSFFISTSMLQQQAEKLLEGLAPPPSCIISDMCLPWTADIALKFHIPRLSFLGVSCLCLLCLHNLGVNKVKKSESSESEYFVLPGSPDHLEFTKSQLPLPTDPEMKKFTEKMVAAEQSTYGFVVNTFQELEPEYVKRYRKAKEDRVWCIGPVSLCNKDNLDKVERGKKAAIEENECLKWLDAQEPTSVVYVCLGSLCYLISSQLIELGLGLEASKKPFIWVIGGTKYSEELEKWISENRFEERIKGRGLLIRGWAPQLLILSHPSVGGFLSHCGWNSTIEAICAGVPMLTWPLSGDQFVNEKLVVQVLKIGVRVGVEDPVWWGEEEKTGALVEKGNVKVAIDMLMDEGEKKEERRKRARKLGEMAKRAVADGGSSDVSLTLLIQDLLLQRAGCEEST